MKAFLFYLAILATGVLFLTLSTVDYLDERLPQVSRQEDSQ